MAARCRHGVTLRNLPLDVGAVLVKDLDDVAIDADFRPPAIESPAEAVDERGPFKLEADFGASLVCEADGTTKCLIEPAARVPLAKIANTEIVIVVLAGRKNERLVLCAAASRRASQLDTVRKTEYAAVSNSRSPQSFRNSNRVGLFSRSSAVTSFCLT